MSLDISITNKKTGDEREMNWLRNPFGLCNWAEDNYQLATETVPMEDNRLWHVINYWNYDKSSSVDRELFKKVVDEYWRIIKDLDRGYFVFDTYAFVQFVLPHFEYMPLVDVVGSKMLKDTKRLRNDMGIPMEYFNSPVFNLGAKGLIAYKDWFEQLVEFANLLQDKDYEFYCSN